MKEKVSIIVPVYNGEKYLSRCLDSLISQTYKNIEIIVINDGSKDKTMTILNKYKKLDARISVIDKKNTGVSDTRNIGIDKATGKYVCFCDCDDMYKHNYIEVMYKTIKEKKVDVVRCNYEVIDRDGNILNEGNLETVSGKKYNQKDIINNLLSKCFDGTIPCFCYLLIIDKQKLKTKFPIDIAMMEDVIFYLELLLNIESIYVTDSKLYTIMYNDEGATNNVKNYERNINNITLVNAYIKRILNEKDILNNELKLSINFGHLNAISDFIFRHYLYSNDDTIELCKKIRNDKLLSIINETNLNEMNVQRRIIIRYLKNENYQLLKIYFMLRKIVFKIRN